MKIIEYLITRIKASTEGPIVLKISDTKMSTDIVDYEKNITDKNDIPNKKFVEDEAFFNALIFG